jgi:gliding motility-associated-like protein
MNICGGNMRNTYGDMKLTKVSNGAYGILRLNRNRLPTATNLMVLRGRSTLVFTNLLTGCTDSLVVNAACVTPQRIENTLLKGKSDTLYLDTHELIGSQFKIRTLQNGSDRYVHFTNVAGTVGISRQTMNIGTDDITYVVTDEYGISDTTYLITHVTEAAFRTQRPIASDDDAETSKGKAVYVNVMANDTLFTNNATVTIITEPKRGTAIVMSDFSVLYTPNPNCNSASPDVFRYILCNQAGCDTATVAVTVACDKLKICTGFSPNNDGVNDYFIIEGVENHPKNNLTIYNRWGISILDVKSYKNDWGGTWNGQVVPDGTYFYLFNDGEGKQQTGYIQIQR